MSNIEAPFYVITTLLAVNVILDFIHAEWSIFSSIALIILVFLIGLYLYVGHVFENAPLIEKSGSDIATNSGSEITNKAEQEGSMDP